MAISKEELLVEMDDIIRTMPPRATLRHDLPENFDWFGRAAAAIYNWDSARAIIFDGQLTRINDPHAISAGQAVNNIIRMLHQASHELRMETSGPTSVAIDKGKTFQYFDELREIIESAKSEIFFVDQYLDAEFITRYFPYISNDVSIRLLAGKLISKLVPAVDAYVQENKVSVEIRSSDYHHDRYIFIDNATCHQSGASFKDGAKVKATGITQITDAFKATSDIYEDMWGKGKVVFKS